MTRLREITLVLALVAACGGDPAPGTGARQPTAAPPVSAAAALAREERRAYAGAPPVIPHAPFGADCTSCHTKRGLRVDGVGFAPPTPHEQTPGLSSSSNCRQCHVFQVTDELHVANGFEGLSRPAAHRAHDAAPPVMPHRAFMREDCLACHAGPAAREEIVTTHPERANCRQCHVASTAVAAFAR